MLRIIPTYSTQLSLNNKTLFSASITITTVSFDLKRGKRYRTSFSLTHVRLLAMYFFWKFAFLYLYSVQLCQCI